MISQQERTRLVEAYRREPCVVAAVMVKCVGGLLIVGALAIIGATSDFSENEAGGPQAAGSDHASAPVRGTQRDAQIAPAQRAASAEVSSVDSSARSH
jgi:hypothetical protein